jgi:hypothetical protein
MSAQSASEVRYPGTEIMTKEAHTATGTRGARGVRVALVSSGVSFMALLGFWAGIEIVPMMQHGHTLGGVLLALAALLLLSLAGWVVAMNWRAIDAPVRPPSAPDGNDQTGIWGVGGPSMREPGSTGAWATREVDRRYEDADE